MDLKGRWSARAYTGKKTENPELSTYSPAVGTFESHSLLTAWIDCRVDAVVAASGGAEDHYAPSDDATLFYEAVGSADGGYEAAATALIHHLCGSVHRTK
jgi:hypothetical protein